MLEGRSEYDVVNKVPMTRWDSFNHAKLYLVNTKAEWHAFFELLMQQKLVACDTETEGFHYFKGHRICGLSFGWGKINFYIPVRHKESVLGGKPPPQLDMDFIRDDLNKFFAQKDVFVLLHNAKFDFKFLKADGICIKTPFHDTRILWHLFDENAPGKLKVIASGWKDMLGRQHKGVVHPDASKAEKRLDKWRAAEARARRRAFNAEVMAMADELKKEPCLQGLPRIKLKKHIATKILNNHKYANVSKAAVDYSFVPIDLMCEYAGLDTYFTWCVYNHVMTNMSISKPLMKLYVNELKLSNVLQDTEERGVLIDRLYLLDLENKYDAEILELKKVVELEFGGINTASNQQLSNALVEKNIPLTKKTDGAASCSDCLRGICTIHYAVGAQVLEKLAPIYPAVQKILDLRGMEKLNSTYVKGILSKITVSNVLHCSFNQNVKTGRMSSSDPNLQNIPRKNKSIRRAFICEEDHFFLFIDYSQIEVRLTAHFSQDPLLLDAYARGQDVHTRTMCEVFGHDYDEVHPVIDVANDKSHPRYEEWVNLRATTKGVVFGIIYGIGAPGLSEQIPMPPEYGNNHRGWVNACQDYIDQYLDKYLEVKRFINEGGRHVRKYSQIEDHFGRIRHLPHAKASRILKDHTKGWLEARAKRQGVNFLIQGAAADLFKIAVVRVADFLEDKKSRIVNFVHDEIQIYLHKSEVHLVPQIKALMEDFPEFTVPIIANIEFSKTDWASKQDLKSLAQLQ